MEHVGSKEYSAPGREKLQCNGKDGSFNQWGLGVVKLRLLYGKFGEENHARFYSMYV